MFPIGVCGDNCSYCPRYIATKNGSANELEKVRELWARLGLRDAAFAAQDLTCFGCKPETKCAYSELRACAGEKEIDNCGFCAAYPCKLIDAAFEKTAKLRSHAAVVCTPEEMDILYKGFFSKKQNLDQINHDLNEGKKKSTNKRPHRRADRSGSR